MDSKFTDADSQRLNLMTNKNNNFDNNQEKNTQGQQNNKPKNKTPKDKNNNKNKYNNNEKVQHKDKKKYDESIQYILDEIQVGSEKINIEETTTTLVLGTTGSGKTTLCAFLSGQELIVKTKDYFPCLEYKLQDEKRKIGNNPLNSETQIPNKFKCKDGRVYWDCPGFIDTKGVEQDIINSFYTSKIIQNSKKINFILVINGQPFEQKGYGGMRGETLKLLIGTLFTMLHNTDINLSQNLLIVFSQTKKEKEYYQKKLISYFEEVLASNQSIDSKLQGFYNQRIIKQFIEKLMMNAKYEIFPRPVQNEGQDFQPNNIDQLNESLKNMSYYEGKDIEIPFSINCLDKIDQLWSDSQKSVCQVFYSLSQKISSQFSKLKEMEQFQNLQKLLQNLEKIGFQQNKILNERKFNLIVQQFIEPFLKLIKDFQPEPEFKQYLEKINQYIDEIQFFLTQLYDTLFSKVKLGEYTQQFFGQLGYTELSQGIIYLFKQKNLAFEKYVSQKDQQQQIQNEQFKQEIEQLNRIINEQQNQLKEQQQQNAILKEEQRLQNEQDQQQKSLIKEQQRYLEEQEQEIKRITQQNEELIKKIEEQSIKFHQQSQKYKKEIEELKEKQGFWDFTLQVVELGLKVITKIGFPFQ